MSLCLACGRPHGVDRATTSEHRRIAREIVQGIEELDLTWPTMRMGLIAAITAALDQASERRAGHE